MKKLHLNNKGYAMTEALIVSTVVLTALVLIYLQFTKLNSAYGEQYYYNNVNGIYALNEISSYISNENNSNLVTDLSTYVDITSCNSRYFSNEKYCKMIMSATNIEYIFYTYNNKTTLTNALKASNPYDMRLQSFVKTINTSGSEEYMLVAKFKDGYYAAIPYIANAEPDPIEIGEEWDFRYNGTDGTDGTVQVFVVPETGSYKLEVWGAQGGSVTTKTGGLGGYSKGEINLNKDDTLYIVVGGQGESDKITENAVGGYNGGGNGIRYSSDQLNHVAGGGGATHIAIANNSYNILSSYSDAATADDYVYIVAGGGGGAYYHTLGDRYSANGGSGGGTTGGTDCNSNNEYVCPTGGTQTTGGTAGSSGANGTFGAGGTSTTYSSGGGSGWYGGGSAKHIGTAGGSGYLSDSLRNSETTNGQREEHGYAKITYIGEMSPTPANTSTNEYGTTIYEGTIIDPAILKYFNVTTGEACTETDWQNNLTNNSQTNEYITSGCMQFYAYMEDDLSYTMVLDHVLQGGLKWNSLGTNTEGPSDIIDALDNNTSDWQGTIIPNDYIYTFLDGSNNVQSYTIPYKTDGYKARLITMDEITRLVGNDTFDQYTSSSSSKFYLDGGIGGNWSSQYANSSRPSQYFYLFSYMYNSANYGGLYSSSRSGTEGSWTSDAMTNTNNCAWDIRHKGSLECNVGVSHPHSALRPVISVLKSKFN